MVLYGVSYIGRIGGLTRKGCTVPSGVLGTSAPRSEWGYTDVHIKDNLLSYTHKIRTSDAFYHIYVIPTKLKNKQTKTLSLKMGEPKKIVKRKIKKKKMGEPNLELNSRSGFD